VARAVQSLADTQTQQGLAAAAAAASAGGAASKFASDMAKDSGPVKDMVNQLLSMKGGFDQLKLTAESATLPGFTQMLRDSGPLFPIINGGISDMGLQLSGTAIAFGHLFQNTAFQDSARQFTGLMTAGFGQFASALPPLLNAIVTDGAKAGPLISAVATGIHDVMATGLPDFLSGLTVNASGAALGVTALFNAGRDLLGPVGTLSGAFAGALGPALAGVEPQLKILADDIVKTLLPIMPQLSDALLAGVDVLGQLLPILEPLIPMIGVGLSGGLSNIIPLLRDTAGFLHDNADWLGPVAEGVLGLVVAVKAWNIASGLASASATAWKSSMKLFSGEAEAADTKTVGAGAAIKGLAGKVAGAVPIFAAAIPLVLDLGHKIGEMAGVGDRTGQNITDLKNRLLDMSQGLPGSTQHMQALAVQFAEMGKVLHQVDSDNPAAVQGMKDLDKSVADLVRGGNADQAAASFKAMQDALVAQGFSIGYINDQLFPAYNQSLKDTALAGRSAALGADATKTSVKDAGGAALAAQTPFQGLTLRLLDTGQAGRNSALDLGKLDKALSNIDAQIAKKQALDEYNKALGSIKDGAAGTSKAIDGSTQSAIDNRGQLEQGVTAARHFYDTQLFFDPYAGGKFAQYLFRLLASQELADLLADHTNGLQKWRVGLTNRAAGKREHADHLSVRQHREGKRRPLAGTFDPLLPGRVRRLHVADPDRRAGRGHAADQATRRDHGVDRCLVVLGGIGAHAGSAPTDHQAR